MTRRSTLSGILFLLAGIAVFSVQDLILKRLSGDYPLHQAMVLRSATAIPFLLMLVHRSGGWPSLFNRGTRWMIARGLVMFLAYTAYYLALPALPIATTVSLYFSAPLFITVLSVLLLGEKVSGLRWLAVLAGFAGVLVMVRPGRELFEWAALLPVISGMAYGLSMIVARLMGESQTAAAQAFWGNAVFLCLAAVMALTLSDGDLAAGAHPSLAFLMRPWVMPTGLDLALMMGCGVIAAAGLVLLTQAYRIAEANAVAPFEYSAMIWGLLWGWWAFGDWPVALDWAGIAIITGAGLAVVYAPAPAPTAARDAAS